MSQLLASLEDIEAHTDKPVTEELVAPLQVLVYRTVRSQLSPRYSPITLAGWHDPEHTPTVVRSIAAKLIAAYLYCNQDLYDHAITELKELANGAV